MTADQPALTHGAATQPYAAPRALVGDVGAAPEASLLARALRVLAIAGNAVLALVPVMAIVSRPPNFDIVVFCAVLAGIVIITTLALTTRIYERWMWLCAILLNGIVGTFCALVAIPIATDPGIQQEVYWVILGFAVPLFLNLVGLVVHRRARKRDLRHEPTPPPALRA